ncbi:MAG: hypothetical protein U0234_27475 [Sandaracinus sp.]
MQYLPQTAARRPSTTDADAIARRAAERNGAVLLWWIIGVSVGCIPLAILGVVGIGEAAMLGRDPDPSAVLFAVLPTAGLFVLALAAMVGLIQLAIFLHRRATYESVMRMLSEGAPHVGRIVQARRVSMTQSRVSVQGTTFTPFDELLVTNMADAALYGREVTVYTRPGARPMILPFD